MLARQVLFFLYFDAKGEHIGNSGFQVDRRIFGYHQIDYRHRGRGLGMATTLATEELLAQRGFDVIYLQVYRDNRRALTAYRSLGYEIDDVQSTVKYYTLKKILIKHAVDE